MVQYLIRCTKEYKSSKEFEDSDFECPGLTLGLRDVRTLWIDHNALRQTQNSR